MENNEKSLRKSVKLMLANEKIVGSDMVAFFYIQDLIKDIEENNGKVSGAFVRVSGKKIGGNKIHDSIIRLMKSIDRTVYKRITGVNMPITPKQFLGRLYTFWENYYKED